MIINVFNFILKIPFSLYWHIITPISCTKHLVYFPLINLLIRVFLHVPRLYPFGGFVGKVMVSTMTIPTGKHHPTGKSQTGLAQAVVSGMQFMFLGHVVGIRGLCVQT